jgi:hypothetical protein
MRAQPLARYLLTFWSAYGKSSSEVGRIVIVLRIVHSGSVTLATIRLEGKLLAPWVDEVRSVVATVSAKEAMCLNLEQLSFADAKGIELLRELRRKGVALVGGSPLIEGLLASYPEPAATSNDRSPRK